MVPIRASEETDDSHHHGWVHLLNGNSQSIASYAPGEIVEMPKPEWGYDRTNEKDKNRMQAHKPETYTQRLGDIAEEAKSGIIPIDGFQTGTMCKYSDSCQWDDYCYWNENLCRPRKDYGVTCYTKNDRVGIKKKRWIDRCHPIVY